MWRKVIVVTLFVLAFVITVAILYGRNRWQSDTRELQAKMEMARVPISPKSYEPRELSGLPTPVQHYFRVVLKKGQPLVTAAKVEHTGTFNMSNIGEQWKQFKSAQRVIAQRPGFVWNARIRMAPAMTVYVHDAYVAGVGVLTAKLFGLLTVMKPPSTPELAHVQLMRFLAEKVWNPTALLPSQDVAWSAIKDRVLRTNLEMRCLNVLFSLSI